MTSDKTPFKLNLWALVKESDNEINNESIDIKKDTIEVLDESKKLDKCEVNNIEIKDNKKIEQKETIIEKKQSVKIDLRKMKNNRDKKLEEKDNSVNKKEIKKEEENTIKNKEDKVNKDSSITWNNNDQKEINIKSDEIKDKEDIIKVEINKDEEKSEKNISEENKNSDNNDDNIDLDSNIEDDEDWKDLFKNYESDLNKNKDKLFNKINKLKNLVKPKTRVWFLILIVILTIIWIATLFLLMPEKHNINTYEENLFKGISKIECSFDESKCPKPIIEKEKIIKKEDTIIKEEKTPDLNIVEENTKTIKKWITTIEYNTKIVDWKEVFIYKWIIHNNINELNIVIDNEIENTKKDKLKNYLQNLQK